MKRLAKLTLSAKLLELLSVVLFTNVDALSGVTYLYL